MTFHNLNSGSIVRAIAAIFIIGLVIIFALQSAFVMARMWDTLTKIDSDTTQQEQEDIIQKEVDAVIEEAQEGSPALERLTMIQWGLVAVITFFLARRTASRQAGSPEQGTGYGAIIGLGAVMLFGLCICTSTVTMSIQFVFLLIIVAAGVLGGRVGGFNPRPQPEIIPAPSFDPLSQYGTTGPGSALPAGSKPETYYNMGLQAALAGRREEARQHFTRVLQMQPRSVAAWLQLANLADTPEQAWNYVQQARSINPTDPAVMHAVDVIWPKVAAQAQQTVPRAQPPYSGGAQDDTGIPRTTLPGGEAIPPLPTGPTDEEPDSDIPQA
jgi:tetratricopeptide (TPR) repeat protein